MRKFLIRLLSRFPALWFLCRHGWRFQKCGFGARLFTPFRVEGWDAIQMGRHSILQSGGWLYCKGVDGIQAKLTFGKGCEFGYNNHIAAVREVVIGDHVLTANNVYISDNLHGYDDISRPIMHQPVRFKGAVSIGDGSWIGENACIIGARIGRNCVVGANAVVTRDIPDFSIAVGIPAAVIRKYDPMQKKWVAPHAS